MAVLLVHGGAGTFSSGRDEIYRIGLKSAVEAGYALLTAGGSAVTAVLEAVSSMESNAEAFNAGVGGALTRTGDVELDACVMLADGSTGAVGGVRNSRNPVLLADLVRRTTPHVLLIGEGAEALETAPVTNDSLKTSTSRSDLDKWLETNRELSGSGTVGAVAFDDSGSVAAATSSGGIVGQYKGRLGDTPIPGAGTWADAHVAVSGTGKGEAFIRSVACKSLADRLAGGGDIEAAITSALADLVTAQGYGGFIVATTAGSFAFGFNTPAMAYAFRAPGTSEEGLSRTAGVRVFKPAARSVS